MYPGVMVGLPLEKIECITPAGGGGGGHLLVIMTGYKCVVCSAVPALALLSA